MPFPDFDSYSESETPSLALLILVDSATKQTHVYLSHTWYHEFGSANGRELEMFDIEMQMLKGNCSCYTRLKMSLPNWSFAQVIWCNNAFIYSFRQIYLLHREIIGNTCSYYQIKNNSS